MSFFPGMFPNARGVYYVAQPVTFDGVNDYLVRGAGLTGAADSGKFTFSAWINKSGGDGVAQDIITFETTLAGATTRFVVWFDIDNKIYVNGFNAAGTLVLKLATSSTILAGSGWHHILSTADMASIAGNNVGIWVDDVAAYTVPTFTQSSTFDFTGADLGIGAHADGSAKFSGDMADLYFAQGFWFDFTVTANRRKFIDGNKRPAFLGANGSLPIGSQPIVFCSGDVSTWATNDGAGGGFTEKGGLMQAQTSPSLGYGIAPPYNIVPIHFDGVNDYLTRGAGLTGAADSGLVSFSLWVNHNAPDNTVMHWVGSATTLAGSTQGFRINRAADGSAQIIGTNSSNTNILSMTGPAGGVISSGWRHICGCVDMSSTAKRFIYIDDVAQPLTVTTYTNAAIDFTYADWSMCGKPDGTTKFNGDVADVWLAPGVYFDFSVLANRRKFIDSNRAPVYLGADGSLPTGTAPLIFCSGDLSTWATNDGTGGGFTTHGALTAAQTSPALGYTPPSYSVVPIHFDGMNSFINKGAALTGAATGKQVSFSFWVKPLHDGVYEAIIADGNSTGAIAGIHVSKNATNGIIVTGVDGVPTVNLNVNTPDNVLLRGGGVNGWYHVCGSFDLSSTAKRFLYVNDVAQALTVVQYVNNSMYWVGTTWGIGAFQNATNKFAGGLADVWCDSVYLDMSVQANRRKFRDASGLPVDLGELGELPNGSQPLLFFAGDIASWQTNRGNGGAFTEQGTLTLESTSPSPGWTDPTVPYIAKPVTFDGTNDYLTRGATFGTADSKSFVFSGWVKINTLAAGFILSNYTTVAGAVSRFNVTYTSAGTVQVWAANAAGTQILFATSAVGAIASGWHHILCSIDLSNSANHQLYIDDVSSYVQTTFTNDTIDFTVADWSIGAEANGTSKCNADFADLLFGPGLYVDFSVTANRRRFIDANGYPVYLGEAGEIPGYGTGPVLFSGGLSTWHTNKGTGGGMTLHGALTSAASSPSPGYVPAAYSAQGIAFDGSTRYLTRGAGLTGAADGKLVTFSLWVRNNVDGAETDYVIGSGTLAGPPNRFQIKRLTSNVVQVFTQDATPATALNVTTAETITTAGGWTHILGSVDLSNSANRSIYINGVAATPTWTTYANANMDLTLADWAVGGAPDGTFKLNGELGEVWVAPGVYIDFSVLANRQKFIDANGWPVFLGLDGSIPTGTAPLIYQAGNVSTWQTNNGTGGGMTLHGTLAASANPPPLRPLKATLANLGLTTNLKLCLDAGDAASYNPAVQTASWLDTSGGAYDFYRGTSAVGDAAEPTFNGTAGVLDPSTYWNHDGGDYFTLAQANPTWVQNLHKNNALFTIIAVVYFAAAGNTVTICGNNGGVVTTGTGMCLQRVPGNNFQLALANGAGQSMTSGAGLAITTGMGVIGLSVDEATGPGGLSFFLNGNIETTDATYVSPFSSAPSQVIQIGARGNAFNIVPNGTRFLACAMWEGTALTAAQMTSVYNAIKRRFGLS